MLHSYGLEPRQVLVANVSQLSEQLRPPHLLRGWHIRASVLRDDRIPIVPDDLRGWMGSVEDTCKMFHGVAANGTGTGFRGGGTSFMSRA